MIILTITSIRKYIFLPTAKLRPKAAGLASSSIRALGPQGMESDPPPKLGSNAPTHDPWPRVDQDSRMVISFFIYLLPGSIAESLLRSVIGYHALRDIPALSAQKARRICRPNSGC